MTAREGIQQVWREIGWTEDQIAKASAYADIKQPNAPTHSQIRPGTERQFIDEIKRLMLVYIELEKKRIANQ